MAGVQSKNDFTEMRLTNGVVSVLDRDINDTVSVDIKVVAQIKHKEIYDDGRVSLSCLGLLDPSGTSLVIPLQKTDKWRSKPTKYRHEVVDTSKKTLLLEELLPSTAETENRIIIEIGEQNAKVVNEALAEVKNNIRVQRRKIQDRYEMKVVVDNRWKCSNGDNNMFRAKGRIKFNDGRVIPVQWKSATNIFSNIGYQAIINRRKDEGYDVDKDFDEKEIDAAMALAHNEPPVPPQISATRI